jgi:antitoxin (DNA-binding transcriptional repressor) of toxin-antitoxin stability system
MKVIDLNEAKANLEQYARDCQCSPVIVTVDGKPSFEMIPIRTDDPDFIDRLLEQDDAFRRLAEERRREADEGGVSPLVDVRRRLDCAP